MVILGALKNKSTKHCLSPATELEGAEVAFEPRSVSRGSKDAKKCLLGAWMEPRIHRGPCWARSGGCQGVQPGGREGGLGPGGGSRLSQEVRRG